VARGAVAPNDRPVLTQKWLALLQQAPPHMSTPEAAAVADEDEEECEEVLSRATIKAEAASAQEGCDAAPDSSSSAPVQLDGQECPPVFTPAAEEGAGGGEEGGGGAEATEAAEAASVESLRSLGRDLDELEQELADYEVALDGEAILGAPVLREMRLQIPTLNGTIDRIQAKVDGVPAPGQASKTKRRRLTEQSADLSGRARGAHRRIAIKASQTADASKEEGNGFFRAKDYSTAAACYSEAIAVDKSKPAYWCNRASCHLNLRRWAEALADASEALQLDAHYVKAYQLQARAQLQLKDWERALVAVQSVPLSLAVRSQRHGPMDEMSV
jgi:tetratricopeptide (TPR) repeat protein